MSSNQAGLPSDLKYLISTALQGVACSRSQDNVAQALFLELFRHASETGYMTQRIDDVIEFDNRNAFMALVTVDNSVTDSSNGDAYRRTTWLTTGLHDQLGNACFGFVCDFLSRLPWMALDTLKLRGTVADCQRIDREELAKAFASVRNNFLDFRDQCAGLDNVAGGISAVVHEYTDAETSRSPFNYALDNFAQFSIFLANLFTLLWETYSEWKRTAGDIPDFSGIELTERNP